jgi:hypothetical protein
MKMVGDIFLTMQTYQEIHSLKFLIIKSRFDFKRHGVSYNQIR